MSQKQNLDNYINNATSNIVEDRAATKALLMSLMDYMKTGEDKHREFGAIAAKYLETLQRSRTNYLDSRGNRHDTGQKTMGHINRK